MALTVIPAEASSWASDCVKPMMPNLEAQYAARRAPPFLPHWDDMLMMRPRTPRSSIERATACEVMKVRSEEHTSELQSRGHLVCRLLLEKKKKKKNLCIILTNTCLIYINTCCDYISK